jgi:hypothetical protein
MVARCKLLARSLPVIAAGVNRRRLDPEANHTFSMWTLIGACNEGSGAMRSCSHAAFGDVLRPTPRSRCYRRRIGTRERFWAAAMNALTRSCSADEP